MILGIPIVWLAVFLAALVVVYFLKAKLNLGFGIRVFLALVIGTAIGLTLYLRGDADLTAEVRRWFSLIGYGYVDLLRMLIVPLVPASIIAGLLKLKDRQELKELGGRTIRLFLITATIASFIGIVVASILNVGAGIATENLAAREPNSVGGLLSQLRGFIPSNPVSSAAETQMIPLVVFALFVGVAGVIESGRNAERVEPFRKVLESYLSIIIRVAKMVIRLTPYGVVGLMAYWMSYTGISAIADLGVFVVGVVIACVIQVFVVYSGFLFFAAKVNPLKFFKAAAPSMLLAFTSRSSLGSLTLTVNTMENRLKVKPRIANFVGPIGAVMNMDACGGIFPAMVAIFAANAFGLNLSLLQYVLIVVVSIIASIGSAGVPMGATAFTIITLTTVGLPVEAVGLVAGVDFLVDMFRTATNVTGDMMVSVVVADKLGEFDRTAFEASDFSEEQTASA
jgi:uncharacterized protein